MTANYTRNTYAEKVVDDDVGLLVWGSVGWSGVEEDWVEVGVEVDTRTVRDGETG
jgi:hypothetical protein